MSFKPPRAGRGTACQQPLIVHSTLSASSQLNGRCFDQWKKVQCMCETGAEVTLLPTGLAERQSLSLKPVTVLQPVSVDQAPVRFAVAVRFAGATDVHMDSAKQLHCVSFCAVNGIEYGILGLSLLIQLGAVIDCSTKAISIEPFLQTATIKTASVCRVRLEEWTVVLPGQECFLSARIEGTSKRPFDRNVEAVPEFISHTGLAVAAVRVSKGKHTALSVSEMSAIVQLMSGCASQLLNCQRLHLC